MIISLLPLLGPIQFIAYVQKSFQSHNKLLTRKEKEENATFRPRTLGNLAYFVLKFLLQIQVSAEAPDDWKEYIKLTITGC